MVHQLENESQTTNFVQREKPSKLCCLCLACLFFLLIKLSEDRLTMLGPTFEVSRLVSDTCEFEPSLMLRTGISSTPCMCCAKSLSCIRLFGAPRTVAHQASLSMGFSRQEYWNGLPCPPLGGLLDLHFLH